MAKLMVMSLEDWSRADVNEIRGRWEKRRRELEEIEKKAEKEKRIEELKKRKEKKRKRVIRERRCFVCGIFGHMACYCRNREEKEGPVWMPKNKFEVLKDRVMERGEGSGKEVGKDRREILKEERVRKKKTKAEKKEKKDKKEDDKKEEILKEGIEEEKKMEKKEIEEERDVEM